MAGFWTPVFGKSTEREVFKPERTKKTLTGFGEIIVSKSHPYMQGTVNRFAIRPLMRELIVYAGHLDRYAKSEGIPEKFTRVKAGTSQVYRVAGHAGESLKDEEKRVERILPPLSKEDVLCVGMDGSVPCTRWKDPWKEVKPGRLFKGGDCPNPDGNASCLEASQYVARIL